MFWKDKNERFWIQFKEKKDRDCTRSLFNGAPNKDLVPKLQNETKVSNFYELKIFICNFICWKYKDKLFWIPFKEKKDRNCPCPLFNGAPNKDLVPKSEDETEKRTPADKGSERCQRLSSQKRRKQPNSSYLEQ